MPLYPFGQDIWPRGTPQPIIDKWNQAIQKALADPKVVEQLTKVSLTIDYIPWKHVQGLGKAESGAFPVGKGSGSVKEMKMARFTAEPQRLLGEENYLLSRVTSCRFRVQNKTYYNL